MALLTILLCLKKKKQQEKLKSLLVQGHQAVSGDPTSTIQNFKYFCCYHIHNN